MIRATGLSPPPCNPDEVPSDLKCSICLGIPLFPVLTPCEHIFCKDCIHSVSLNDQNGICPICRGPYKSNELKELQKGTFIYRLWSNIRVKCTRCEEGCTWTGSIEDFLPHFKCMHINNHEKMMKTMKDYIDVLECNEASLKVERKLIIEKFKAQEKKHMWEIDKLKVENLLLQEKYDTLLAASKRKTKITHKYKYSRKNISELTRKILYNAEKKLHSKDAEKIFKFVTSYYEELLNNDPDHPEKYDEHVKGLLKTCVLSKCFSKDQNDTIEQWMKDQGWDLLDNDTKKEVVSSAPPCLIDVNEKHEN